MSLSYQWSIGSNQLMVSGLDVGNYSLVLINEKGCEVMVEYILS